MGIVRDGVAYPQMRPKNYTQNRTYGYQVLLHLRMNNYRGFSIENPRFIIVLVTEPKQ